MKAMNERIEKVDNEMNEIKNNDELMELMKKIGQL